MKLKTLTFNVHKARSAIGLSSTLEKLKLLLKENEFDLIFLQEIVGRGEKYFPKDLRLKYESQLEYLADGVWSEFAYGKNAVSASGHHGNAILSRYPIVKWENQNISVNRLEQRGLLHAEIKCGETVVHLFNVHLNLRHQDRLMQIEKTIQRAVEKLKPQEPFILAGDFNDWNQGLSHRLEEKLHLQEAHKNKHGIYGKTFPNLFPLMTLDRIYSRNLIVLETEVLHNAQWKIISDHLPLATTFVFK